MTTIVSSMNKYNNNSYFVNYKLLTHPEMWSLNQLVEEE